MHISTQGLLLQAIPYLGEKKILKVFTPEEGLISLFANKTKLTPFSHAEWIYRKSEKEIHTLQDASLIDPLLHLRESYNVLISAGAIAQDLLQTQAPGKKADELFELSLFYLKKLTNAPELLVSSFRLKLLLHEGLLSEEPHPSFSPSEWETVSILAFSRKLSTLLTVREAPHAKIQKFFDLRWL